MFNRIFLSNRNLLTGSALTLATGIYLIYRSWEIGKNAFFLQLNQNFGPVADGFFRFWTNMGDGMIWVAIALLFYVRQRNRIPLLVACIAISTLITQLTKNFVFPAEPRPTAAIKDTSLIHTVPGVEIHTAFSFPSGHTATAFTIFLLACLLMKNKWVVPLGFVAALMVGYSRIYLAQHFPLDVGAGMITALITILFSIIIQEKWEKQKSRK